MTVGFVRDCHRAIFPRSERPYILEYSPRSGAARAQGVVRFAMRSYCRCCLRRSMLVFKMMNTPLSVFLVVQFLAAPAYAAELPLQALALARVGGDHGVFVRAEGGRILAKLNSTRPYHPASVTKVATTLAFLSKLPLDYRFRTTFRTTGPVVSDTLEGNLLVHAEGDPYFLLENAFLVLLRLREMGIRQINGGIRVSGPFFLNWTPDPEGRRLKRAWMGRLGSESWATVTQLLFPGKRLPLENFSLRFGNGSTRKGPSARALVIHASPPLLRHLKDFNSHSNDIFHEFSYRIGGPETVQEILHAHVRGVPRASIVIENAAGDGRMNQLSPRAVVAMFDALGRLLAKRGLSFSDVLPVAGVDPGSLRGRLAVPRYRGMVAAKSGTVRGLRISVLAGLAQTRKYGRTLFAIMIRGVPLGVARERQNAFLRGLLDAGGPRALRSRPASPPAFMEALLESRG